MKQSFEIIDNVYTEAVKGLISDESILHDFDKWNTYYLDLPRKEQLTYSICLLDWQVKNGGFHQYFFNSYGIFCFYTVENLREIKCDAHADLLYQAISIIYDHKEQQQDFQRRLFHRKVEAISDFKEIIIEKFEPLEEEYYRIEESEEIHNKLGNYLIR